jgi:hypothetical protein
MEEYLNVEFFYMRKWKFSPFVDVPLIGHYFIPPST